MLTLHGIPRNINKPLLGKISFSQVEKERKSTSIIVDSNPTSIKKEWRTTTEWLSQPCKLYHHEVFGILNNGGGFKGVVTECKDDSIQITDKTKEWIKLQDIKSLMWK